MGELQLPNNYDDESPYSAKHLSAREKADQKWGMKPNEESEEQSPTDDLDGSESVSSSAKNKDHNLKSAPTGDDTEGGGDKKGVEKEPDNAKSNSQTPFNFNKGKGKTKKGIKKRYVAAAGVGVVMVAFVVIFIVFLSSLKVIHFAEVLETSGYARFNGIMQERMTQNIFDASLTEGEGSVTVRGRSIIDRFKFRNVDSQLAELGRDGRLGFGLEEGTLKTITVGEKLVSVDAISNELFGKSYSELSDGLSKLNPRNAQKAMTVRAEVTRRLQAAVGEEFQLEPRYIRSRIFGTVADNIGFKFSGWRQKARDYIGLKPIEADTKNKVDEAEKVLADEEAINTGVEEIDNLSKSARNIERVKAFLEKNGNSFDDSYFEVALKGDIANATRVQGVASTIGTGVLVASLACMTNTAFSHLGEVEQNNEKQASKIALDLLAKRDQTKAGDVEPQAVSATATQLDGAESASGYLYDTSQTQNIKSAESMAPLITPAISDDFRNLIKTLTSPSTLATAGLISIAPPLRDKIDEEFCGAILSPTGAIVAVSIEVIAQAIVGFLSDGGSIAAEEGLSQVAIMTFMRSLGEAVFGTVRSVFTLKSVATIGGFAAYSLGLSYVTGMLSGTSLSGAEEGPGYYERAKTGMNLVQERSVRSIYGKPISDTNAKSQDKLYAAAQKTHWQSKSFATRFVDIHNPFSFIGSVAASSPTGFNGVKSIMLSYVNRIGSAAVDPFSSLIRLMSPAHALAGVDYNPYAHIQQWGFSPDEIDKLKNDPTYSAAHNIDYISDDEIAKLDKSIGKCFDPNRSQTDLRTDSDCTAEKLSDGPDNDYMALRYRALGLDKSLGDIMDGQTTSEAVTNPPTVDLDAIPTPDGVTCPTSDTISTYGYVTDAYKSGVGPLRILLCNVLVSGKKIRFNVLMVSKFDALFRAFNAAGFNLDSGDGDGYRTYAEQAANYKANPGNFTSPGRSNHEFAIALDIKCSGRGKPYVYGGKGSTSDRGLSYFIDVALQSPCLKWIHDTSSQYNLLLSCDGKNSSGQVITGGSGGTCEPWHLSPTGG